MDLPLVLKSNSTFVTGVEELKQNLYLLLKEPIMSWYQSTKVGSRIALHSSDKNILYDSVKDTLAQINGVEIEAIDIEDIYIKIKLNYNGRKLEEVFKIEN